MPEHSELEIDSVISRQNVAKEGYTTFYVDKATGNDAANFLRWETAAKTIQAAVDKAESWCKIYVKSGTYTENISITDDGIYIIGETRDGVLIKPAIADDTITLNGRNILLEELHVYCPVTLGGYAIELRNVKSVIKDCLITSDNASAYGVQLFNADEAVIDNVKFIGANIDLAIWNNDEKVEIKNCTFDSIDFIPIVLQAGSDRSRIHDNTFIDCEFGIQMGSDYCNAFHNNFVNTVTTPEIGITGGPNNHVFENYYSGHTTDTNNDGLCDSPYTLTGGVDYSPISHRDGWLQDSLGMTPSSSITIANIFNAVNAILTLTETGATITTDGALQTLYINNAPAGVFQPRKLLIDFTNHVAGDVMIIRTYYRLKTGGGLIKQDEEPIVGVQDPAIITIDLEDNRFGYEVTIEKTVGANLTYDWEVLYKA